MFNAPIKSAYLVCSVKKYKYMKGPSWESAALGVHY